MNMNISLPAYMRKFTYIVLRICNICIIIKNNSIVVIVLHVTSGGAGLVAAERHLPWGCRLHHCSALGHQLASWKPRREHHKSHLVHTDQSRSSPTLLGGPYGSNERPEDRATVVLWFFKRFASWTKTVSVIMSNRLQPSTEQHEVDVKKRQQSIAHQSPR